MKETNNISRQVSSPKVGKGADLNSGWTGGGSSLVPQVRTIRVGNPLLENMGHNRNLLRLFEDELSEELVKQTEETLYYTPEEEKLIFALLPHLWDHIEKSPEMKKYISRLSSDIERRRFEGGKPLGGRVEVPVDITALARDRYGKQTGKVDNVLKKRLLSTDEKGNRSGELVKLSERTKTYVLKSGTKTLTLNVPLITLGASAQVEDSRTGVKKNGVLVTFEDVFLYDILNRYSVLPRNYPYLRIQFGNDSEVFRVVEKILLRNRGEAIKQTEKELRATEARLRKEGADPEVIEQALSEVRSKGYVIERKESFIADSLLSNYYTRSKGRGRGDFFDLKRFREDLQRSIEGLCAIGIITGAHTRKPNEEGGLTYVFHLNEKWLQKDDNEPEDVDFEEMGPTTPPTSQN